MPFLHDDRAQNYIRNQRYPLILAYHGVTTRPNNSVLNYAGKHIMAEDFARQMDYLAAHHEVVSLTELVKRLNAGEAGGNLVVITFDDGYENNYHVAWPILRERSLPATFFLTTGLINTQHIFWVDRVEHLLAHAPPGEVKLHFAANTIRLALDSDRDRINAVILIKRKLKRMPPHERRKMIEHIHKQVGGDDIGPHPDVYYVMKWEQIHEMDGDPLVTFGGHTVTHAILSNLSRKQQQREIGESHHALEGLTSYRNVFAYPNGRHTDYDHHTIALMKEHGFVCATNAEAGFVDTNTDLYELNRVIVRANGNPYMRQTIGAYTFPFEMQTVR